MTPMKFWAWGVIAALGCVSATAAAQEAAKDLTIEIDGRKAANPPATSETLQTLTQLSNHSLVCMDVKITVDGSKPTAILTSNEGDLRRYPVDCRKGQMGSFPMAAGLEYYLPSVGTVDGAEIDVEIYPGSRTTNPFNDVDCVTSTAGAQAATFHLSGFYTVRSHNFGSRRVIEFRPAPQGDGVSRSAAARCLE